MAVVADTGAAPWVVQVLPVATVPRLGVRTTLPSLPAPGVASINVPRPALNVPPQAGNLPPITREIVRRIASAVLARGAELLASELTRENGFLDYSLWASLGYQSGLKSFALDYFHDREEFEGFLADTLIASVTFPVSGRLDLELRLGATDSDLSGTIAFAGVTLIAFLGK